MSLMFEDAGVPYVQSSAGLYGPKGVMDAFRGGAENVKAHDDGGFPIFFPPAVIHKTDGSELRINQCAAVMTYLGEVLGFAPATPQERARADTITQNALDYISDGRRSFHPVKNEMSYHDQKEEGDAKSKEWCSTKMLVWLQHFEKLVKHGKSPAAPVAGGERATYADFCLWHVLDATCAQFNNEFYGHAWDAADVPSLKEFYAAFGQRPRLRAYLDSDRRAPWGGDSMM